jgi:hypothetical protein
MDLICQTTKEKMKYELPFEKEKETALKNLLINTIYKRFSQKFELYIIIILILYFLIVHL